MSYIKRCPNCKKPLTSEKVHPQSLEMGGLPQDIRMELLRTKRTITQYTCVACKKRTLLDEGRFCCYFLFIDGKMFVYDFWWKPVNDRVKVVYT